MMDKMLYALIFEIKINYNYLNHTQFLLSKKMKQKKMPVLYVFFVHFEYITNEKLLESY